MKIRILTNNYPPEIGAAANQLYELAQALSARGHQLSVVTRFPRHLPREVTPGKRGKWIIKELRPEAEVLRINIPQFSRRIPLLREIEHFLNFILFVWAALVDGKAEATLVYSPPIVVGYAALAVRYFNKGRVVLNVQDLFPQSLIDIGALKNRYLIAISRMLEKSLYNRVDLITVMSEGNQRIVAGTACDPDKVKVMPNWVDTDYIVPGEKDNEFRKEHDLKDKFILTFAGCIADSQDMEIILNCAERLKADPNIIFLIAGNGPRYEATKEKARDLKNVMILPIQPREKYVKLLAASDVALVTLSPMVATPVVPSKILSIMAAGRPILASLPLEGDAPRVIKEAGSGIVVAAGDKEAFYAAVVKLFRDPKLREELGKKGREAVVTKYSLQVCAEAYENLFNKLNNNGKT